MTLHSQGTLAISVARLPDPIGSLLMLGKYGRSGAVLSTFKFRWAADLLEVDVRLRTHLGAYT